MKLDSSIFDINGDSQTILLNRILNRIKEKNNNIDVGETEIQVFSDNETCVNFNSSMRGKRVYLLTTPNSPLKFIQLTLAIDAAKRASAAEIIPIIPYFPYARQDKRDQHRGPIGARVIAEIIQNCGATSIITFDLHSDQMEGFFNIPVIHMRGKNVFYKTIVKNYNGNTILCSPDAGGVKRVKKMRDIIMEHHPDINLPYVTIDKTREGANHVSQMSIIGDVKGKHVLMIDDMCDTGGTLVKATDLLLENGALSVSALVTHAILSGKGINTIGNSRLTNFIYSDSIYHDINEELYTFNGFTEKALEISIDEAICDAIISINNDVSLNGAK